MLFQDIKDLHNIVLNAPIGICILDAQTLVAQTVNDKFLEVAGKPYEAIFGQFYWDAFAEVRNHYEAALAGVIETGEAYYADQVSLKLIRHGKEEDIFVTFVYSPVKSETGRVVKVAVWVLENTKQVAERQLAESVQKHLREAREQAEQQKRVYEAITSGTPDLMYVFDLNYRFTYVNSALLAMWGKTWENAVGKNLLENGYEPWHAEMHEREIDQVRATKKSIRGEVSFPHATLGRRIYDYIFTPVFNQDYEVEAVAGVTRDITERKQWEDSLTEAAKEIRAVNEQIEAANEELTAANEELIQTNQEFAILNQQLLEAQTKIEESETALRLAINAANFGTWFIHSVTREFITNARSKELFGYYPEESLSIEQALAQITDEYRGYVSTTLENAIYGGGDYDVTYPVVGLHDQRLRWLRAIGNLKADPSGAFSAFTGVVMDITESYLAAKKVADAEENLRIATESGGLGTWYLDDKQQKLITSSRFNELFGYAPDEEISFKSVAEQIDPEYRQMVNEAIANSLENGALFNLDYPITRANDGELRWVRSIGKFVRDEKNGNYITGVIANITEQKADDIRKNDFISMVSHELKTPLTSLSAIVQIANVKLKSSNDGFLAGAMEKAHHQVKKMTTMINGFLNISRLESGKILINKQDFDLERLLLESIEDAEITLSAHSGNLISCGPVILNADRDKIASVISNFISNAVKYSPAGTTITVKSMLDGSDVIVSVQDEGLGIMPADIEKIFERYYRVETNYTQHISGFGIGLYLSSEIIRRHGGKVWAESEMGKGSTFFFKLPLPATGTK